ncbi:hypothetical protein Zmor_002127 [Zophobas morio]|uniref:Uncharacterized protein n=1 Tax=Zophobas morio TaxID=2755281 RepID=A0AA38J3Z8_9CUCU|nr:hypothetical protein Zmor_002087 [Zophobas morio]KAJ3666693.1 hypothetical protein Zmor_002127 [Zophobas morio]
MHGGLAVSLPRFGIKIIFSSITALRVKIANHESLSQFSYARDSYLIFFLFVTSVSVSVMAGLELETKQPLRYRLKRGAFNLNWVTLAIFAAVGPATVKKLHKRLETSNRDCKRH